MKKQPEITAATRNALVEAFCALYKVQPIETITIRAVTERAGYNRSTFYQYFEDIYALLTSVEDTLIARIKTTVIANIESGDLIEHFIMSFTTLLEGQEPYLEALLENPNSARFISRLKSTMIPVCMEKLHLSQRDVRARYILEFYLPAAISSISFWIRSQRNIPVEELGALIRGVLQHGVMAQLATYAVEPWELSGA